MFTNSLNPLRGTTRMSDGSRTGSGALFFATFDRSTGMVSASVSTGANNGRMGSGGCLPKALGECYCVKRSKRLAIADEVLTRMSHVADDIDDAGLRYENDVSGPDQGDCWSSRASGRIYANKSSNVRVSPVGNRNGRSLVRGSAAGRG